MSTYDINELKDELVGLSLQEKRERLEDIQAEIDSEMEELEAASSEVSSLLADVEEEVNVGYDKELLAALKEVAVAHNDQYPQLPNNTLDIEGLHFRFFRYCCEESKLNVDIEGRKHIVRVRDFQKDFDALLKTILPDAYPSEKKFVIILKDSEDISAVVKNVAEKLISVAPKIKEMAGEYKFV